MKNYKSEAGNFFLRSLAPTDDLTNYLFWMSNPSNNQFILSSNNEFTIEKLKDYIDFCNSSKDILLIGIFDKFNNEHIGNIKYSGINKIDKSASMGILIGEKKYRGIGLAKEVIQHTLTWIYGKLGIEKVLLGVNKGNKNALNLYKKIGFAIIDNDSFNGVKMELNVKTWLQIK
jgi:ribosomal-protein-alanine N-acetyltransferase